MSEDLFVALLGTGLSSAQVERLRELHRLKKERWERNGQGAPMSAEAIQQEVEEVGILNSGTPEQADQRILLCMGMR